MSDPSFFMLYVDNPPSSAAFYSRLLGRDPVEASPTFAMFALDSGCKLCLWSRHTVKPEAAGAGGGGETAFALEGNDAVDAAHAAWKAMGVCILQEPTAMEFGYTFVALDPDNHRLRVFAPGGE
ncbi:Glyoxalase/bleomycin resistance protein/dioxygenase [uncultured delta proteobacterium]|uniref:Glyoxalase/bleomycin resistance protein/dioxygenase n=1 Tax=uncultured delta proteobacterium TaxID=34034 RepID=A0A212KFS9_9DELT|nr:Glyoxalase/bleomycin resistance protein/dioxygenase [uncultured delta proteobacterium]